MAFATAGGVRQLPSIADASEEQLEEPTRMRKAAERPRREIYEADARRRRSQERMAEAYRERKEAQAVERREHRRQNLARLQEQQRRAARRRERRELALASGGGVVAGAGADCPATVRTRSPDAAAAAAALDFVEESDLSRQLAEHRGLTPLSPGASHQQSPLAAFSLKGGRDAEAADDRSSIAEAESSWLPKPSRRSSGILRRISATDDERRVEDARKARSAAREARTVSAESPPIGLSGPLIKRRLRRTQQKLLKTTEVAHFHLAMRSQFRRILEAVEAVPDPTSGKLPASQSRFMGRTKV